MASLTVDYIDTGEAQDEADRIGLALHDLAYAVRHEPAEVRDHVGAAERLARDLLALYGRVGDP